MSWISLALAIFKAIPIIDEWFQQLAAAYVASQLASMKKENAEAIRKAINEHDQRDLEKVVGHPNPGQPSGDDGAVIVDDRPPGVSDS